MLQLFRIALLSNTIWGRGKTVLLAVIGLVGLGETLFFLPGYNNTSPSIMPHSMLQMTATATETAVPTETATATNTPFATSTVVPTEPPTATSAPAGWDIYEPNDTFETASSVNVNVTIRDLTLSPANDRDYFRIYGKAGQILHITTFVQAGTDTMLRLYTTGGTILAENDDKSATDLGSSIIWTPVADSWFIVEIESAVPGYEGRYDLAILLEMPTPTASPAPTNAPGPTSTPVPTVTPTTPAVPADQYEPNNSVDGAAEIIVGTTYQATLPTGDVDYYRLLAKSGNKYQCDTKVTGVDTAITILSSNLEQLAANDDRAPNDVGSTVIWTAETTATVYIAVQNRAGRGEYTLVCDAVVPPPPASGGGGGGNYTPPSPTATATPFPTATPSLLVRHIGNVQPTPTAVLQTVVRLVIVYDQNNNRAGDIGEGISNISVRALYGGSVVAWGLTDERGEVTLHIIGNVDRITIPYLNFWEMRVSPGTDLEPRTVLIPSVSLPVILPIETPVPPEE